MRWPRCSAQVPSSSPLRLASAPSRAAPSNRYMETVDYGCSGMWRRACGVDPQPRRCGVDPQPVCILPAAVWIAAVVVVAMDDRDQGNLQRGHCPDAARDFSATYWYQYLERWAGVGVIVFFYAPPSPRARARAGTRTRRTPARVDTSQAQRTRPLSDLYQCTVSQK